MIIQCPSCGFSGRVPGYAATAPHHARCPKCQFRFSIADRAAPIVDPLDGAARLDLRHDLTRPRHDPSTSSYEIKALTDDFPEDDEDERDEREWDEDWKGAIEADDEPPTARPVELPPFLRKRHEPPPGVNRGGRGRLSVDPILWYSRLYQSWAVLFIAWAAIIGFRAVLATIRRDEDFLFSMPVIWPVASVVLLVSASASLFLLTDFNRRLRPAPAADPAPATAASGFADAPAPRQGQGTAESMVVKPRKFSAG
jgi:hypothetical protein